MHQDNESNEQVPGLLLVMNDVPQELDEEFNHWYHTERLEDRLSIPGFNWARRYRAVDGQPEYMVVYQCQSIDVLESAAYRHRLDNPNENATKFLPKLQNVTRAACRQTWTLDHAIGGSAIVVQCNAAEGRKEDARRFVKHSLAERLKESGCMVSMSLWEADSYVTATSTSEIVKRASPDHYADWVILVEGYDLARLSLALHGEMHRCDAQRDGLLIGSLTRYELMCCYKAKTSSVLNSAYLGPVGA